MKKRIQRPVIRAALTLFICLVLFSLSSVFLEAGLCEDAFFSCWEDLSWMSFLAVLYCGNGYLFCKRYLG